MAEAKAQDAIKAAEKAKGEAEKAKGEAQEAKSAEKVAAARVEAAVKDEKIAENRAQEAERTIEELRNEIKEEKHTLEELRKEIESKDKKIESLKIELFNYKKNKKLVEEEKAKLENAISENKEELRRTKNLLQLGIIISIILKKKIDKLSGNIENLENENSNLKQEVESLSANITNLKQELSTKDSIIRNLESEIADKNKELDRSNKVLLLNQIISAASISLGIYSFIKYRSIINKGRDEDYKQLIKLKNFNSVIKDIKSKQRGGSIGVIISRLKIPKELIYLCLISTNEENKYNNTNNTYIEKKFPEPQFRHPKNLLLSDQKTTSMNKNGAAFVIMLSKCEMLRDKGILDKMLDTIFRSNGYVRLISGGVDQFVEVNKYNKVLQTDVLDMLFNHAGYKKNGTKYTRYLKILR